jgi:hypothetical protein
MAPTVQRIAEASTDAFGHAALSVNHRARMAKTKLSLLRAGILNHRVVSSPGLSWRLRRGRHKRGPSEVTGTSPQKLKSQTGPAPPTLRGHGCLVRAHPHQQTLDHDNPVAALGPMLSTFWKIRVWAGRDRSPRSKRRSDGRMVDAPTIGLGRPADFTLASYAVTADDYSEGARHNVFEASRANARALRCVPF